MPWAGDEQRLARRRRERDARSSGVPSGRSRSRPSTAMPVPSSRRDALRFDRGLGDRGHAPVEGRERCVTADQVAMSA